MLISLLSWERTWKFIFKTLLDGLAKFSKSDQKVAVKQYAEREAGESMTHIDLFWKKKDKKKLLSLKSLLNQLVSLTVTLF